MRSRPLAAFLLAVGGCGQAPRQPVAETPVAAVTLPKPRHVPPDVRFVQGMISHHAQALEMTKLVAGRTSRAEIRLLAERIDVSQKDEIALMRRWLERKGAEIPDPDAHLHAAMGHGDLMPGMLTAEELDQLAKANGTAFDRLFLQFMIRHHEGALRMVADLFSASGAHDTQLFSFASDVDADQRAEIKRMQTLQRNIQ